MKGKRIVVVCHDAGAAELIAAYIRQHRTEYRFRCFVSGPAEAVFARAHLPHERLGQRDSPRTLLLALQPQLVIVGVDWSSPLGLQYIAAARSVQCRSAAYLDHWVNFRERFGYPRRTWKRFLPDEIWVGDRYALVLARKYFGAAARVRLRVNEYFRSAQAGYAKIIRNVPRSDTILFMSEPITMPLNSFNDDPSLDFSEIGVLGDILMTLRAIRYTGRLIIRLHPAEARTKFDGLIRQYGRVLRIGTSRDRLLADIAKSRLVIGMDSMALAIASLCRKPVISYIPDPSYRCTIPYRAIIRVRTARRLGSTLKRMLKKHT